MRNLSFHRWQKYEFLVPLALFLVFLAVTLPGIAWGAPSVWHPDEIVVRSIKAVHGEWKFSEINFDYPDLPQYAMFWLGKLILALGHTDKEILIASRVLSAVLAGLTIILTYVIVRRAGGNVRVAGLSGLLLLCVSDLPYNGRFAHNDTYLVFFTTLTVLFLVEYGNKSRKSWLYAAFITVGMAASSKYIGGSLLIAPVAIHLIQQWRNLRRDWLAIAETFFIGGALTFLGFAFGTPKALTWMAYYFKRVYDALQWQIDYGRQPDSLRGILGQYNVLADMLGIVLYLLFAAGFVWACYQVVLSCRKGTLKQNSREGVSAILLLAILALDLPIMVSYNYQPRYFLALIPPLAILSAFLLEDMYSLSQRNRNPIYSKAIVAGVALVALFSFARITSLLLLFVNDARIPASEFIKTLPVGTSLEHTYYPPTIPGDHFEREHNYPVHFLKTPTDQVPVSAKYVFNAGEAGLDDRLTDYFITDSFTYSRFNDPRTCETMQIECDFFKQLETGRSNHYRLIAEFSYTPPPYLPRMNVQFANPTIRVYERIK